MKNKINIAQLLKDCPEGMELDCAIWDDVEFREVDTESDTIILRVGNKFIRRLDKYGQEDSVDYAKCVIFPKGETTWEGFHRPYINGDVIVDKYGAIALYKQVHSSYEEPYVDFHCGITSEYRRFFLKDDDSLQYCGKIDSIRFATEEEKEELFKAIKEHGYEWNAETKTLEKIVPEFKDGEVLVHTQNQRFIMSIYHKRTTELTIKTHCILWDKDEGLSVGKEICCYVDSVRLATGEEKQKLFKAIEEYGYKWDEETKTLKKMFEPKFHEGDWIACQALKTAKILSIDVDGYRYEVEFIDGSKGFPHIDYIDRNFHLWTIEDAKDGDVLCYETNNKLFIYKNGHIYYQYGNIHYHCSYYNGYLITVDNFFIVEKYLLNYVHPATKEQRDLLFSKMREAGYAWNSETKNLEKNVLKFKVGDRIRKKGENSTFTITEVNEAHYFCGKYVICDTCDNNWELVPNKFNISTLKPYDKVLARDSDTQKWGPELFSLYDNESEDYHFQLVGAVCARYCIPYEGNEHLSDTTNDCSDFYKTWE